MYANSFEFVRAGLRILTVIVAWGVSLSQRYSEKSGCTVHMPEIKGYSYV